MQINVVHSWNNATLIQIFITYCSERYIVALCSLFASLASYVCGSWTFPTAYQYQVPSVGLQ